MTQQSEATMHTDAQETAHAGHPTPLTYFKVAMILVAITAAEVAIFYANWLSYGIIPILVILSVVKFMLVAMFYMHLRYEHRLFSTFFIVGLLLASLVLFALLSLFNFFI